MLSQIVHKATEGAELQLHLAEKLNSLLKALAEGQRAMYENRTSNLPITRLTPNPLGNQARSGMRPRALG